MTRLFRHAKVREEACEGPQGLSSAEQEELARAEAALEILSTERDNN